MQEKNKIKVFEFLKAGVEIFVFSILYSRVACVVVVDSACDLICVVLLGVIWKTSVVCVSVVIVENQWK